MASDLDQDVATIERVTSGGTSGGTTSSNTSALVGLVADEDDRLGGAAEHRSISTNADAG